MRRQRNMIAAVLLLCAVELHCSDGVSEQDQACVPSYEAACFVPADYLNGSGSVDIEVRVGKKLIISLEHFSEYPVCHWIKGAVPVLTVNGTQSMVLPPLSETDSGEYTLSFETSNGTRSSMTISLHVMKRPTKPKLTLEKVDVKMTSPSFTCISEGYPKPKLEWSGNNGAHSGWAAITISSSEYSENGVMCCATNAEGQECSQLYDYDLESDFMKNDEVSNVTVSPGQSLLLRCRIKHNGKPSPVWESGSKTMDAKTLACSSKVKKEVCIKNDSHEQSKMAYLFIESLSVNHSGTYICRRQNNKKKSVDIHVQAEGFLSVQLDKSRIIPAQNASCSCLEASVSYHPVLQHCSWEAPDKKMIKCTMDKWVTKHRTVKLCDVLISGDYKLHLEAGGQKETKTISVCVVGKPEFIFRNNINPFTVETESLVPANYTWKSCSLSNIDSSSWKEIPGASQTDSNVSCKKTITSSLSTDLVEGHKLMFCLTNSVGSWCEIQNLIYTQPSKGYPYNDNGSLMVLKVGSMLLLLALAVVSVVLLYFVKKKKPKYQPQLQMIQMIGPNDNDYIYINFEEFGYDQKWEFPRENLELGQELGSGAFGKVVQATAYGINKPGVSHQVAVKMLKEKHQTVEKEALMSELKMLTHIGHHTNIVNLLGACTESGPIYLIFQYCRYGDLLNYLKTNRERYHKSVTDAFNKDRFSSLYHNLQPRKSSGWEQWEIRGGKSNSGNSVVIRATKGISNIKTRFYISAGIFVTESVGSFYFAIIITSHLCFLSEQDTAEGNYMPMFSSTTRGQEDIALLTISSGDIDGEDPATCEDHDNQTDDLQTLTFDDLLSFAFQVAKGMEFLSSKNCIHRDLAARNVLVTNGRLVKIGDFGLARDIDNDSNYVVRGNVRLPVKWMAPESTFQGIYTMKSDVWAYGILLWEIFSLGVTPYPGMKVDHTFYSMIERGFKMECPYYANESVYGMMCKCWALDPCNRPSFSKLVSFMYDQLTNSEEELYHNMLDQTSSEYQNPSAILVISALTKQNENKTANDYCQTHATEESKAEVSDSDTVAAEEKLVKPSDTE